MQNPYQSRVKLTESEALEALLSANDISPELREKIGTRAVGLVRRIREDSDPGVMELFLGEYGLSSAEGIALMCLAEALLRVPDDITMDALIDDKIAPSEWGKHLGKSHSSLVNASTWALFVTGKVLDDGETPSVARTLRSAIKRLGEPVIRQAVSRVMKEMGRQFVLGQTIESAMRRGRAMEAKGFTYSYDMLGEAARTEADAKHYHIAYCDAISALSESVTSNDIRANPGISIKLSALHPRYETAKKQHVMDSLVPRAHSLAVLAKSAGIGLNIDAEEQGRLELSLEVIETVLRDPAFKNWDGFGVVVQAYGLQAPYVLDWLYDLAKRLDRRIMVRLVKGAYWDTEIKLSQVEGHDGFPVFTRKASTDVSYICCAKKLLGMTDRIYPQFATHNAHTVAAILELAEDKSSFEFQRLHGMGEAMHTNVLEAENTRCRIYAPVGAHKDLLAYLVRRLLENGANSSFVNQIVDEKVPPEAVASDPFEEVKTYLDAPHNPAIQLPHELFEPGRRNSRGWNLHDPSTLAELEAGIAAFDDKNWHCKSGSGDVVEVINPATRALVGTVQYATAAETAKACKAVMPWSGKTASERAAILCKAADLYEDNVFEICSLLMREAGKTLADCIGELREAVDFLRYYAVEAEFEKGEAAGIFACISPWNFPLAIFTGQVAAALAVGNGVVAKPAEATCLIADFAVSLLIKAGVPKKSLKLLAGTGAEVGSAITENTAINGMVFTGSTATAQHINRAMAKNLAPHAALIAETGGLNAMVVDSTALPEQAVRDVIASAFQSAGQRCSALRILYLQKDIADGFLKMLYGAMDELELGDPRLFSTDVGPIIDQKSAAKIKAYVDVAQSEDRLLKHIPQPVAGHFIGPCVVRVNGIEDMAEEIFGPVLHIATFASRDLSKVLDSVNNKGFGLTFGLHSRIDDRVQYIVDRVKAGNIYINRNQIGAVVGSQPFGGESLSGTGPKAGGPRYLKRFVKGEHDFTPAVSGKEISAEQIDAAFARQAPLAKTKMPPISMPGPTGESNQYSLHPRKRVLCLGPTAALAMEQAAIAREIGCMPLAIAPDISDGLDGVVTAEALTLAADLDAVVIWSDDVADLRQALAARDGAIIPLLTQKNFGECLVVERHVCVDTTAAGGNAELLGGEAPSV